MEVHDLHGWTVKLAEDFFHEQLNRSRLQKSLIEINFITGVGVIRDRLMELAKENDLYAYIPLGNRGCIVVEFE